MRRPRLHFARILSAFLSVAVLLPWLPARGEEAPWVRLETEGFTLFSNAEPEVTVEVGAELSMLRGALEGWMGGLAVHSPMPTFVYVFRDEGSFWPYKQGVNGDPRNIAGYFLSHPLGNYVAVNGAVGPSPSRVIYHEYLHQFVRDNLPGMPLWFNEGLAELYGSFEVRGEKALVGLPHESHVRYLRQQGMMPLRELLAVGPGSELYNESSRRGVFYAQSWLLVHYLMVGDGVRGEQLIRFLDQVAAGVETEEAFEAAFDARFSTLEEELQAYLAEADLPVLEVAAGDLGGVFRSRLTALPPAEVQYRLGDLAAHAGPRSAQFVRGHFDRALELQPDHGGAWAGLGYLEDLQGSSDEAAVLYEKALELTPGDFRIHFLLGRSLLQVLAVRGYEGSLAGEDLARLERAIRALERSLELHPDFPEALATLGAAWVYHPRPEEEGLRVLARARRWLPERADVVFNQTVLAGRLGHRAQARSLLHGVLEPMAGPEMAEQAREAIARAELLRARDLARGGEVEEATAALRALVEEDYDLPLAASAQALLDALEGR
ncbi:MAG: hypothetical protein KDD47_07730 [Acidobacteria bacterium]|nr:hypothetical protein [Acidobacteriota bacterium]